METLKPAWKRVVAPLLLLILGMIFGAGLTGIWILKRAEKLLGGETAGVVEEVAAAVAARLMLTAEQKKKIDPTVDRVSMRLHELQMKNDLETRLIVEDAVREISPELRPEQREKLDKLLVKQRERWRRLAGEQ